MSAVDDLDKAMAKVGFEKFAETTPPEEMEKWLDIYDQTGFSARRFAKKFVGCGSYDQIALTLDYWYTTEDLFDLHDYPNDGKVGYNLREDARRNMEDGSPSIIELYRSGDFYVAFQNHR